MKEAVHSGIGGGICPDSLMILRNLLNRIENSSTGEVHKDFHVEIPKNRLEEVKKVSECIKDKIFESVKFSDGVSPLNNDYYESILNNTWRPTFTVTGITGFPEHKTAGNVQRPCTNIRICMRLPPTKNYKEAEKTLVQNLTEKTPFNAKVELSELDCSTGYNAKEFSSKLKECLEVASQKAFGKSVQYFGGGGSIPFINTLANVFSNCEILVLGVLGPDSNAHIANESLHIPYCKKITTIISYILNECA